MQRSLTDNPKTERSAPRAMAGGRRMRGRGFTIVEMLVGVGAVAIVSVGLAAIFDSVGKTVTGGRRLSVINTYAGMVETQLRRDFGGMSRDGFLIIRNQWVDRDGNGQYNPATDIVQITPDLISNRGHRIDELEFVINGAFKTARQPTVPGVQAESNTAVVYYGHGQVQPIVGLNAQYYKKAPPVLDFRDNSGTNNLGMNGVNRYAGDWMLLRHQTLLASPSAAASDYQNPTGLNPMILQDKMTQVALQPASSSIFRALAYLLPATPEQTFRTAEVDPSFVTPLRSSGVVDISSQSLTEIRSIVNGLNEFPATVPPLTYARSFTPPTAPPPAITAAMRPGTPEPIDRMHAWLSDAMPTDSRNQFVATSVRGDAGTGVVDAGTIGSRLRYEPAPTDLLAALRADPSLTEAQVAARRADQLLLASSNFIPHCTDFIVDWSFGQLDAGGSVVWFGLPWDGMAGAPAVAPLPYPQGLATPADYYRVRISDSPTVVDHVVTARLIYGVRPLPDDAEASAYFGWVDPTFAPPPASATLPSGQTTTNVVPWAWPKMVRITLKVVDPQDPAATENTLQFIFDLPKSAGPQAP